MAQSYGEPKAHELPNKGGVFQICLQLAHLAPVTQNQGTKAVQLMLGKACSIRVFEDVGAVAVVVAVRDAAANFMQTASPVQLAQYRFGRGG